MGRLEAAQVNGTIIGDHGEQHPAGKTLWRRCIGDADIEQDLALLAVVDDIQHLVERLNICPHSEIPVGCLVARERPSDQQLAARSLLKQFDSTGHGLGSREGFRRLSEPFF